MPPEGYNAPPKCAHTLPLGRGKKSHYPPLQRLPHGARRRIALSNSIFPSGFSITMLGATLIYGQCNCTKPSAYVRNVKLGQLKVALTPHSYLFIYIRPHVCFTVDVALQVRGMIKVSLGEQWEIINPVGCDSRQLPPALEESHFLGVLQGGLKFIYSNEVPQCAPSFIFHAVMIRLHSFLSEPLKKLFCFFIIYSFFPKCFSAKSVDFSSRLCISFASVL